MSVKRFSFSAENMRTREVATGGAEGVSLAAAWKTAGLALPAGKLVMWRIQFGNERTGERSGFLGQGETLAEAWADGYKAAFESGRVGDAGVTVVLSGGRAVVRHVASFESDETFDQEQARLRIEAEKARLQREAFAA